MASLVHDPEHAPRESLWHRARVLLGRWETIRFLTLSNLRAGHRDKLLGNLWNLLDPLLQMLVYFFVFGVLFGLGGRGRDARFSMYILIGVVIWRFISSSLGQAANCIRGNRGLIHEINFPKAVLPIAVTCARFYDLLCGLLVLGVALLVAGFWPTAQMLWVPLLLTFVLMFVTGVVLLVAFLGAFFADTSNVLDVALRLAFYLSPIFYYVRSKPGIPPEHVFLQNHQLLYRVYMLNPVAGFFECFRDALLWHVTPDPWMMGYLGAVSAGVLVVGFAVFARGEGTFAKYI